MTTDIKIEKPSELKDEHLEFLDELRESGVTNMFGAQPYLSKAFPELSRRAASEILAYWMKTFTQRHNLNKE